MIFLFLGRFRIETRAIVLDREPDLSFRVRQLREYSPRFRMVHSVGYGLPADQVHVRLHVVSELPDKASYGQVESNGLTFRELGANGG